MKPIYTWRDLRQFGINALTGEACAYSMRVLADLNEDGCALVSDYLGLPASTEHSIWLPNWNSQVEDKPAIASVMLPRTILTHLAQFAFFKHGALAVAINANGITPIDTPRLLEEYENMQRNIASDVGLVRNPNPNQSRNTHAATGRAE